MEHRAAAAFAVCVDELGDRKIQSRVTQCLDHEIALPGPVTGKFQVLHGAAAAYAEMRADRCDALCARSFDAKEPAPVRMARDRFHLDRFAGQRSGDVDHADGAIGDAVAAMAEPGDRKLLNHAPPR